MGVTCLLVNATSVCAPNKHVCRDIASHIVQLVCGVPIMTSWFCCLGVGMQYLPVESIAVGHIQSKHSA